MLPKIYIAVGKMWYWDWIGFINIAVKIIMEGLSTIKI